MTVTLPSVPQRLPGCSSLASLTRQWLPPQQSLAQQNDTAMRASVAYALGKATKANASGAISLLTSLTADPLPGPKIVALRSLGHVGDREIVPLMKEALHDTNDAVRATAAGALLHLLQQKK